jgi:hypothetical protein
VAAIPQKKGKNTSASRLSPTKMIQKSFFSNLSSTAFYVYGSKAGARLGMR